MLEIINLFQAHLSALLYPRTSWPWPSPTCSITITLKLHCKRITLTRKYTEIKATVDHFIFWIESSIHSFIHSFIHSLSKAVKRR